jgi:hypothetical protein
MFCLFKEIGHSNLYCFKVASSCRQTGTVPPMCNCVIILTPELERCWGEVTKHAVEGLNSVNMKDTVFVSADCSTL